MCFYCSKELLMRAILLKCKIIFTQHAWYTNALELNLLQYPLTGYEKFTETLELFVHKEH